jgi:predicted RNA binding protein YcfA (HicA-like mRNA interferase family)
MVKFLQNHGFEKVPGGKGSHIKMTKPGITRPITVPHGELKRGTERGIMKEAGLL